MDIVDDFEEEPVAKYVVSYTRGGSCARLHKAMGCWRAKRLEFGKYDLLDVDPPPESMYNDFCKKCWRGEGALASLPPVASSDSSGDSSSTSGDGVGDEVRRGPSGGASSSRD